MLIPRNIFVFTIKIITIDAPVYPQSSHCIINLKTRIPFVQGIFYPKYSIVERKNTLKIYIFSKFDFTIN